MLSRKYNHLGPFNPGVQVYMVVSTEHTPRETTRREHHESNTLTFFCHPSDAPDVAASIAPYEVRMENVEMYMARTGEPSSGLPLFKPFVGFDPAIPTPPEPQKERSKKHFL